MRRENTTLKNIGKNIVSLVSGELLCRVIGAVVLLILPRYLGPANYGVYSLALSYLMLASIFAGYGLDGLFIKDVVRDKALSQKYFCTSLVIKESLSFLGVIILFIIIYAFNYPTKTVWAILIVSSAIFIRPFITTYSAVFRAYEKMEYNAGVETSSSLTRLLGFLVVISLGGGVLWIASIIVIDHLILALVGLFLINKKFFKINFETDRAFVKDIFKKSTPFFLVGFTAIIQSKVDLIMISKLATTVEVGLYSAANELISVLYMIPNLVATALFPVFSRLYHESSKSLVLAGNHAVKYIAIIGFPISAGIYFASYPIIKVIYGNDFMRSVEILQILGAGVCILFVANIIAYVLTASEQINHVTHANIISIVLNVALNFCLIPSWGAAGAALASLICAMFRLIYIYIILNSRFEDVVVLQNFIKPLIATGFMSGVLLSYNLNLGYIILIGTIIYGMSIFVLKTLKRDEIIMIRQAIPFIP
jgi:O-antigen/teichoic acid export membrane protein